MDERPGAGRRDLDRGRAGPTVNVREPLFRIMSAGRSFMLRKVLVLVTALVVVGLTQVAPAAQSQAVLRDPDVIFVPTPQSVVDAMLELAHVTKDDVVY